MNFQNRIGILLALLITGCAATPPSSPSATIPEPPPMPPEQLLAPEVAPPKSTALKPELPKIVSPPLTAAAPPPTAPPRVEITTPVPAAATAKKNEPVKTEKPAAKAQTAPVPAANAAPSLALTALEQRLKDTAAIGVFTKLTLKNQVDELLERFRAHYAGQGGTTLAQLRQSYDQLLQKVQGLLKSGDPELASAIANSRESIWSVLTDPVKFAKL